jgi:hypothetical protein
MNNGQEHIRALRDQFAALRARHDSGAMPHATYDLVWELEIEIAWREHRITMEMQRREHHEF